MEWMQPHAQMKRILSTVLHHVFVTADTCCFQGFTRQLFILIWHHVDTQWKLIYTGFFATQVINSNLGIYVKNDLQKSYEQSLPYNERMVLHNCEDKDMNEKYIQLSFILIIWFYQLIWKCKLATIKLMNGSCLKHHLKKLSTVTNLQYQLSL